MTTVPVAVHGAGQAGLAVSRLLTGARVDHVVLDRGRPAESWRARPWESLRLLTPNWMSRLPGWSYTGLDEYGFMTAREVTAYLTAYARSFAAPVVSGADLLSVRPAPAGYEIDTAVGCWHARAVVVATGWCQSPAVPGLAGPLAPRIAQATASSYPNPPAPEPASSSRNPSARPDGGVLVVGASSSGVQLADEIAGSGRDVVLAVGA